MPFRVAGLAPLAALLAAALASGCMSASHANPPPIRLGALLALSGRNQFIGTPEKQTLEYLEREVNARGGVRGRPLEAIVGDTQGREDEAARLAKKMIDEDHVVALIGPSTTVESVRCVDLVQQRKVPMLSLAAGSDIVSRGPSGGPPPWVFKLAQSDRLAVSIIYDYLFGKELTRASLLCANDAFGASGHRELISQAQNGHISIISDDVFDPSNLEEEGMRQTLSRLAGLPSQVLIVWGTRPGPDLVTRLCRQLQLPQRIVQSHGVASPTFIHEAGPAADGVLLPASPLLVCQDLPFESPQRAVLIGYRDHFRQLFGADACSFGGHAWDAFEMVRQAVEKSGPNPAKIRACLEETRSFVGITGIYNFSPGDHEGLNQNAFTMVRIQHSRWTIAR